MARYGSPEYLPQGRYEQEGVARRRLEHRWTERGFLCGAKDVLKREDATKYKIGNKLGKNLTIQG